MLKKAELYTVMKLPGHERYTCAHGILHILNKKVTLKIKKRSFLKPITKIHDHFIVNSG